MLAKKYYTSHGVMKYEPPALISNVQITVAGIIR